MDGILAVGHFCESHGPCVILCTQRCQQEPQQFSHCLTVAVCEACQSLDLKQAIVSKDDKGCFVTTRTPLPQDLAFLLKQAVIRSLSCEETGKDGGTLYFGDNERGHVISHIFTLQDSLARGFQRKYCIIMLMRDKIHLLNSWSFVTKHIKQISAELQEKAANVNNLEQMQKSQRAVRQAQASPVCTGRSLGQLTGEPAIFAHIHLWFTWLLSTETIAEKPSKGPDIPVEINNSSRLKGLYKQMSPVVFRTVCYCYLTGIKVESDCVEIEPLFRQLLPKMFHLPQSGEVCHLIKNNNVFDIIWNGKLPQKLPTLLTLIESTLCGDDDPSDAVLNPHLMSLVIQWFNKACVVSWAPNGQNIELLASLGIQKQDMPLLSYWVIQCRN
ncbi:folliculin isoform X1 [Euwallacea fornicatus]|uniref:folliculin isoform X1 n=1 Tax=Euwallacea fornicatus TaxID=995702 RepID=UPI00338FC3C9